MPKSSKPTSGGPGNPNGNGGRTTRRRIACTFVAITVVIGVFVVRLVDIQVVRAASLSADSIGNRSVDQDLPGSRGEIVDRNGVVLASTAMRYDVTLSPKNAQPFTRTNPAGEEVPVSVAEAAAEVGAITGQTGEEIQAIIDSALAANAASDYAYVTKRVDVDALRAIEKLGIPWIYTEDNPTRVYPDGSVAGNLVGFMSGAGEPQAGLEIGQNDCLASTNGSETYEKGADGIRIPGSSVTTSPMADGGDVMTTIDSDLQFFVQQALAKQAVATGAAWGTVTVMEAKTGKLVAVADYPSVDPNNVAATAPKDRGSRAFTDSFEPGSTYKTVTAASVLDAGLATPNSHTVAPYRYIPKNGANINDSHKHPDQKLTLTGVLIESSNTGMSKFGELLSGEARYNYMKKFGVGTDTETGFPSEDSGILHPWQEWDNQTEYATMFGQGLTTTALQVASIYQTIANDGVRMPVQLVEGCRHPDGTVTKRPVAAGTEVVSPAAAQSTSDVLEMVYENSWVAKKWAIPGYRVAAKTGTAQMPDGKGGYTRGYLVSVSGFAPADDPEYVVSVSIADPVKLNTSAAPAPVFQEVMSQVLKKYRAVPSGAPAPTLPASW